MALSALLRRASGRPHLERPMAVEALKAIAMLHGGAAEDEDGEAERVFLELAKREQTALGEALLRMKVNPDSQEGANRVHLLLRCFDRLMVEDNMWGAAVGHLELGLHHCQWKPREIHGMLREVSNWGMYNSKSLPEATEKYVGHRVNIVDPNELADVAGILCSLVETTKSPLLKVVAQKTIEQLPTMSSNAIGAVCKHFAAAIYTDKRFLAQVVLEVPRVVDELTAASACAVFAFWANHGFPDTTEDDKEEEIDNIGGLIRQISRTLSVSDDVEMFVQVLRALLMLPVSYWRFMPDELDAVLTTISQQCHSLLERNNPPIPSHTVVSLMPKYFQLAERRPHTIESENESIGPCIDAFCKHIERRLEDLVSEESPPFFLVPSLLHSKHSQCRRVALSMLKEASLQDVALPTLQTFRFMLILTDIDEFNGEIFAYLRKNFAFSTEGIPAIQLCTAMRCFALANQHAQFVDEQAKRADREDLESFLEDVVATVDHGDFRIELRSLLSLLTSFFSLEPPDKVARKLLRYAVPTMNRLSGAATPATFPVLDAQVCIAYLKVASERKLVDVPATLIDFLTEVTTAGDQLDGKLKPSQWMKAHDPSGMILPRTEEQKKIDEILMDLRLAPADDEKRIEELGKQYVDMLKHMHPDETRFIFDLFGERVIKKDKILRDVLHYVVNSGGVASMAPYAIASILFNCGLIRFQYYKLMKEMIGKMTEEQIGHLDSYELDQLVQGMARAGVRVAPVLAVLGDRAIAIASSMTAQQAASLVVSFQSIGMHEDAVTSALLKRVSLLADELSPNGVALLLGGPHSHRLPITPMIALPLVQRLNEVVPDLAPYQKTRIGSMLKKTSTIPRELLTGAQDQLQIEAN